MPKPTRDMLADKANTLCLSPVSAWEVAIKVSTGKLSLPLPIKQILTTIINQNHLKLLDLKMTHIELIETMPFHHKDPFDRLLIAQAQAENLTIVSIDVAFDRYGIARLWPI